MIKFRYKYTKLSSVYWDVKDKTGSAPREFLLRPPALDTLAQVTLHASML